MAEKGALFIDFRIGIDPLAGDLGQDGFHLLEFRWGDAHQFQPGLPVGLAAEEEQVPKGVRQRFERDFGVGRRLRAVGDRESGLRRRSIFVRERRRIERHDLQPRIGKQRLLQSLDFLHGPSGVERRDRIAQRVFGQEQRAGLGFGGVFKGNVEPA